MGVKSPSYFLPVPKYKDNFVMQYVGGRYIWRKEPDNAKAVEFMYHKQLIDMALDPEAQNDFGRISWGLRGADKDTIKKYLQPYLARQDKTGELTRKLDREALGR